MDTIGNGHISFNAEGYCNYCSSFYSEQSKKTTSPSVLKSELDTIINKIKSEQVNSKYDCLVGVSGGADSMYVVHLLVKFGLRPLVVHYDNGWDSQLAVKNIEVVVNKLGLDLYTYVNDWEEFKDIQLSFMKASVIDIELVTDQAIIATLYKLSQKHKIKHVFTGHNMSTESILPKEWYHWKLDGLNIRSIHKKFGTHKIKTYPIISYFGQYFLNKTKRIEFHSLLNYVEYNKSKAKSILINEYGWIDYSGKHTESIFTRFYQNYILPLKFNVDKRKAHLASMICSGQITREMALEELKQKPWETKETLDDKEYVLKKFEISADWFDQWMKEKPVSHFAYPSYLTRHEKYVQRFKKLLGR